MKTISAIAALALCLGATAAHAQQTADTSQQERAALNSQEAAAAQQQLDQNAENRRDYDQAMAERRADIRREHREESADQAAYGAALQDYHHAMHQWRADVAACEAGDATRCAPPAQ